MIQSKLAIPPVAERLVARPRVSELLAGLVEGNALVSVCATAGAGKTTAVVQAAASSGRPIAWLTVDHTDGAPGRLLTYLEVALTRLVPGAAGVATGALAAGIPHSEAAGLLAEASGGQPVVLVIDGLERLDGSGDALLVLASFVRYAPPDLRVVVISRIEVPADLHAVSGPHRVAQVGEAQLAFTPEEAAEALGQIGRTDVDADRAVELTGGWVTGVLFEAWRSADHVLGSGGEADPLHGYLASEILGRLTDEDRNFLEVTSLLDEVTVRRSEALGLTGAGAMLVGLHRQHLPVSWVAGAATMRCHPRFREYLVERLGRRDCAELNGLIGAYGDLLVSEGHFEEATEQFLRIDAVPRALAAAERAVRGVVERLDFAVADRWLEAFADTGAHGVDRLATAELMLAIGREEFGRAVRIADRLATHGERDALARSSSVAAGMMAWSYFHLGRIDDARALATFAEPSPEIDAIHYLLALVYREPRPVPRIPPVLTGGPMDALVMRVHYQHGRLREASKPPASPFAAAITAPWRIGALRATGHLEQALALYRQVPAEGLSPAWMHGIVAPELMIDLEQRDEALEVLERGRVSIRASGSLVFELLNRLIEAKLELRLHRDPAAALAILDRLETDDDARRYDFMAEILDTWTGLALLMRSAQGDDAVAPLERAVQSMQSAGRLLELPTAWVLLAEAYWRRGDENAADHAADEALTAAERQGSNHLLLLSLEDFPAVITRRLDAEPAPDSPWHELGRALMARDVRLELHTTTTIHLAEFGSARITVNDTPARPRIAKSVALLAYLACAPDRTADRAELLDALFDGRADDSTRAYLRQAAHQLREALPDGAGPTFDGRRLAFTGDVVVGSESAELESRLARASRLQGEERLVTLLDALAIADRGEYLPELAGAWVEDRRARLADAVAEARLDAAQLAFASGAYPQAEVLVARVLDDDPLKESAWRLEMRIANAVGDEDRVISAYRRCHEALDVLGATPSGSTQQLLDQLRR